MRDLETYDDIEKLLEAFYQKALKDPVIGYFFTRVVPLNMAEHIPVIAQFWEGVIFGRSAYRKNVMEIHQHIHQLSNIRKEHLERWVELFTETIHNMYAGDHAELMKQRGRSIATMMDIKLNHGGISK